MKVMLAIFQLCVGLASGLAAVFLLSSLAGISTPVWGAHFFLFWGGMFAGPLLLVIGSSLTLAGAAQKAAAVLTMLGSGVLTCWAISAVSALPAERARGALSPGLVEVIGGIVLIALASDLAAYKIYRLVSGIR